MHQNPLVENIVAIVLRDQTNHLFLREPAAEDCAEGLPFPALSCFAFHSAHRFRCASPIRLRAAADIFREPLWPRSVFGPVALWSF